MPPTDSPDPSPLPLTGRDLTVAAVVEVARQGRPVELSPDAAVRMRASRAVIERAVTENRTVYGGTTGFGDLAAVDSIPTDANQEDHVSMGATAALHLRDAIERAQAVLAIEALCAAQGLDFRAPLRPGAGVVWYARAAARRRPAPRRRSSTRPGYRVGPGTRSRWRPAGRGRCVRRARVSRWCTAA